MHAEMQPVVVNARFLTQRMTGVQRFATEICKRLKKTLPGVRFVMPPGAAVDPALAAVLGAEVIGSNTGHKWEQWDLPMYLRRNGKPLLLNLISTAPLMYSNQVSTLHDVIWTRYPESYSRNFRMAYQIIVPAMLKRSRAMLTVSEFSKKEICEQYGYDPRKIFVVKNAGAEQFVPPAMKTPGKYGRFVLAVSSQNVHKNFARLVEAFGGLTDLPDVKLLIVGEKNKSFAQIDLSREAAENVQFLGRVSDAELVELYQQAELFAFPSLYEGFGLPPLEAQACGCAVVAARAASMPEVLGDSALYCDPLSVPDIRRALHLGLTDTALRAELVRKGYENVRQYDYDKVTQCVLDVLARV